MLAYSNVPVAVLLPQYYRLNLFPLLVYSLKLNIALLRALATQCRFNLKIDTRVTKLQNCSFTFHIWFYGVFFFFFFFKAVFDAICQNSFRVILGNFPILMLKNHNS